MDRKLLYSALQRANITKQIDATRILEFVVQLLAKRWGDKIKNKAKPLYVKNGQLVIAVLSSVLANEIRLQQHRIIQEINKEFGKNTVTKISFEV